MLQAFVCRLLLFYANMHVTPARCMVRLHHQAYSGYDLYPEEVQASIFVKDVSGCCCCYFRCFPCSPFTLPSPHLTTKTIQTTVHPFDGRPCGDAIMLYCVLRIAYCHHHGTTTRTNTRTTTPYQHSHHQHSYQHSHHHLCHHHHLV